MHIRRQILEYIFRCFLFSLLLKFNFFLVDKGRNYANFPNKWKVMRFHPKEGGFRDFIQDRSKFITIKIKGY